MSSEENDDEVKKPGNQGKFKPEVKAAFKELLPEYLSIEKEGTGRNNRLKVFWFKSTMVMWAHMTFEEARAQVDPAGKKNDKDVGTAILEVSIR